MGRGFCGLDHVLQLTNRKSVSRESMMSTWSDIFKIRRLKTKEPNPPFYGARRADWTWATVIFFWFDKSNGDWLQPVMQEKQHPNHILFQNFNLLYSIFILAAARKEFVNFWFFKIIIIFSQWYINFLCFDTAIRFGKMNSIFSLWYGITE